MMPGWYCLLCKQHKREDGSCSEFCEQTSVAEKEAYKAMKAGDFGLWPCPICGCVVEDEYITNFCCGPCAPQKKINELLDLLRRCVPEINDTQLRRDIDKAIQ